MDKPHVLQVATVDVHYVTVKDAAKILAVSPYSVYQLADDEVLEDRYFGRRRLIVYESLMAYARSLPETPQDESA